MKKETLLNLIVCITDDAKGENLPLDESIDSLRSFYRELVREELQKSNLRSDLSGFPFDDLSTFFICEENGTKTPFSARDIDILLERKMNPITNSRFSEQGLENLREIQSFFQGDFSQWGGLLEVLESLDENSMLGREDIEILKEKIQKIEKTKTVQDLCKSVKFFGENDGFYLKYLHSPLLYDLYNWCDSEPTNPIVIDMLLKRGWRMDIPKAIEKNYANVAAFLLDKKIFTQSYIDEMFEKAAEKGSTEIVKLLIDRGADIHAGNEIALRLASAQGRTETVSLLLDRGANIHAENDDALLLASRFNHKETVKLLLDRGADIHADNDTALRFSAENGNTELVKLLLENGADIHVMDDQPLRMARIRNREDVINLLLEYGANANIPVVPPLNEEMRENIVRQRNERRGRGRGGFANRGGMHRGR